MWCYFSMSFCCSYRCKVILISSFIRESKINTLLGLIFVWTNYWRFRGFCKSPPSLYHYTILERSCKQISLLKQQQRHNFHVIISRKETDMKTFVMHRKHGNIIHTVNLISVNRSELHVPENMPAKINHGKVFGILIF